MRIEPFSTKGTPGREAIVVVFDLERFSTFFTQQDVHLHAPDFLNIVIQSFQEMFSAQWPFWMEAPQDVGDYEPVREPAFVKFMGDGALFIWTSAGDDEPFTETFKLHLMNSIWIFKRNFHLVVDRARDVVPLASVPERVRFGVTRGTVYGLKRAGTTDPVDYIGFAINLAARLQSYCRELGFIASARMGVPAATAAKASWVRKTTLNLRGFSPEIVYVDDQEFTDLPSEVKANLFK